MKRALCLGALLIGGEALARPPESLEAERIAATAELADLDRRTGSLEEQIRLRERMLKRRLRSLYKLSQGGAFRLIADAGTLEEVDERAHAAERVVGRDLDELAALGDELMELGRDRAQKDVEAPKAMEGDTAVTGLLRYRGALTRPVQGPINIGLQRVRIREPRAGAPALEVPRRSVELSAQNGERVRAVAAGLVRWVGELDGVGRAVIIDHGDRYISVTGRLGRVHARVGSKVREGEILGVASASTVSFELTEGRMPLDPARWLSPPVAIVTPSTAPPAGAPSAKAVTLAR